MDEIKRTRVGGTSACRETGITVEPQARYGNFEFGPSPKGEVITIYSRREDIIDIFDLIFDYILLVQSR